MLTQALQRQTLKLKCSHLSPFGNSESVYKEVFYPLQVFLMFSYIYKSSVQMKFVNERETVDDNIAVLQHVNKVNFKLPCFLWTLCSLLKW